MDIERLFRHRSEGKPRDELVVDFNEVSGSPLPCVFVRGDTGDYDYALTAIPGRRFGLSMRSSALVYLRPMSAHS